MKKALVLFFCILCSEVNGQWEYLGQIPSDFLSGCGGGIISASVEISGAKSAYGKSESYCSPHATFYSNYFSTDSCKTWSGSVSTTSCPNLKNADGYFQDTLFETYKNCHSIGYNRSVDGGITWNGFWSTIIPFTYDVPEVISVYNGRNGYGFNRGEGKLFRIDNDTCYEIFNSAQHYRWSLFKFISDSIGFASLSDTLFKTSDGGLTWNLSLIDSFGSFYNINFFNDSVGYLFAYRTGVWIDSTIVYKTADCGQSWSRIYLNPKNRIYSIAGSIPDTLIASYTFSRAGIPFAFHQSTIIHSFDEGLHWDSISFIPEYEIHQIKKIDKFIYIVAIKGMQYFFYRFKSELVLNHELSIDESNINAFPNPFINSFTFFSNDKGQLEIYNSIGQKILDKDINHEKIEIDATNFSSGIYTLKFFNNQKSQSIKTICNKGK